MIMIRLVSAKINNRNYVTECQCMLLHTYRKLYSPYNMVEVKQNVKKIIII